MVVVLGFEFVHGGEREREGRKRDRNERERERERERYCFGIYIFYCVDILF